MDQKCGELAAGAPGFHLSPGKAVGSRAQGNGWRIRGLFSHLLCDPRHLPSPPCSSASGSVTWAQHYLPPSGGFVQRDQEALQAALCNSPRQRSVAHHLLFIGQGLSQNPLLQWGLRLGEGLSAPWLPPSHMPPSPVQQPSARLTKVPEPSCLEVSRSCRPPMYGVMSWGSLWPRKHCWELGGKWDLFIPWGKSLTWPPPSWGYW